MLKDGLLERRWLSGVYKAVASRFMMRRKPRCHHLWVWRRNTRK